MSAISIYFVVSYVAAYIVLRTWFRPWDPGTIGILLTAPFWWVVLIVGVLAWLTLRFFELLAKAFNASRIL